MNFEKVFGRINEIRKSDTSLCDIFLKSSQHGQIIPAHKIILAGCSKYFEALFKNNRTDTEVIIDFVSCDTLEKIVNFMYTLKLDVDQENAQDLLLAADFFGIESIIALCVEIMIEFLDEENCINVLNLSFRISENNLMQASVRFICEHFEALHDQVMMCPVESFATVVNCADFDFLLKKYVPFGAIEQEEWALRLIINFLMQNDDVDEKGVNLLCSALKWPVMLYYNVFTHDNLVETIISPLKSEKYQYFEQAKQFFDLGIQYLCQNNKQNGCIDVAYPKHWALMRKFSCYNMLPSCKIADGGFTDQYEPVFFNTRARTNETISSLILRFRMWDNHEVLGGFVATYTSGIKAEIGLANKRHIYREYSVELDSNEYINGIQVVAGWFIDSFKFITSQNRELGPYGGDGGSLKIVEKSEVDEPELILSGFEGTTCIVEDIMIITNFNLLWRSKISNNTTFIEWDNKDI